jgi:heat-inducible transcriptional repressor
MEETYRASQEVQGRDGEHVFIGGASQMLESPEFANVEKMRALFKAFEDKYKLLKLLPERDGRRHKGLYRVGKPLF